MKQIKDKLTIRQPSKPKSDAERELLTKKRLKLDLASSIFLIVTGLCVILASHLPSSAEPTAQTLLVMSYVALFAALLFVFSSLSLARHNLSPKDEYEVAKQYQAKAGAYDTIVPLLILVVAFSQYTKHLPVTGVVVVILGIAKFVEWRNARSI